MHVCTQLYLYVYVCACVQFGFVKLIVLDKIFALSDLVCRHIAAGS